MTPVSGGPSRGAALILALLVTSVLSALALGLTLVVSASQMADGNFAETVAMLDAAESGVALAARELAAQADWDLVLAGIVGSGAVDGVPTGARPVPGGGWIDLAAETNRLNCGHAATCSPAELAATTEGRPWGADNPVWRPFVYGPIDDLAAPVRPLPGYLVVWVGDDAREGDGNPLADSPQGESPGGGVVRVHAEVFGALEGRRAVEAELARACRGRGEELTCAPGIRVQSWHEVRELVP